MTPRILLLGMALAACLLSGCSRHSAPEPGASKTVDLGTVEFSPGEPSRHDLGGGAVCILTVEPLGPGRLQLIAVLEKSGHKVSSTRVAPAMADHAMHLSFGGVQLDLTPHLK